MSGERIRGPFEHAADCPDQQTGGLTEQCTCGQREAVNRLIDAIVEKAPEPADYTGYEADETVAAVKYGQQRGLRDELIEAMTTVVEAWTGFPIEKRQVEELGELTDAVLDRVQRHLDAEVVDQHAVMEAQMSERVAMRDRIVREQVAEEIAQAIAKLGHPDISQGTATHDFWAGFRNAQNRAACIAGQHAKGDGDDG